eukprot:TRINITY_DN16472_c0_g1_i2.p1 TRINITY_DN16472_c0_g1~~TRINITY_DN16472_c0_g1_i2.p1  ORF type:complete len:234 (-),score=56.17 TRINITY_DN16472_c0_g1_i2:62-763(-)
MFSCCAEEQQEETHVISAVNHTAVLPETKKKEEAPVVPAPAVEEEAAKFKTVEVTGDVDRDGSPALNVLVAAKDHLLVNEVKPGAVSVHNSKHESALLKVQKGDRIIAINGESGSADELKTKLQDISGAFNLKVEKPRILGVIVKKESQKLGIGLQSRGDLGAIIVDISDGVIASYNTTASADQRVKVNDIVLGKFSKDASGKITVQAIKKTEEMMAFLSQDGDLSLALKSYS